MGEPGKNEILQRVRRIETRLTTLLVALGHDTPSQKPTFDPGAIGHSAHLRLPSPHTSMKAISDAVPDTWTDAVEVFVGSDLVGTFIPRR